MGLDNGFVVKKLRKEDFPESIREINEYMTDGECASEIIYWRKMWGLRGEVLRTLHAGNDEYHITVDKEDIPALKRILIKYLNQEYYETNADSIWEYDEAINMLATDYAALCWLKDYMEKNPDTEVYFYDSY